MRLRKKLPAFVGWPFFAAFRPEHERDSVFAVDVHWQRANGRVPVSVDCETENSPCCLGSGHVPVQRIAANFVVLALVGIKIAGEFDVRLV
jgi:hypothetical protein